MARLNILMDDDLAKNSESERLRSTAARRLASARRSPRLSSSGWRSLLGRGSLTILKKRGSAAFSSESLGPVFS